MHHGRCLGGSADLSLKQLREGLLDGEVAAGVVEAVHLDAVVPEPVQVEVRGEQLTSGAEPRRLGEDRPVRGQAVRDDARRVDVVSARQAVVALGELRAAVVDQEEILVGEIDPKLMEEVRRNWPFLRDRRIDSYAAITKRMID